MQPRRLAPALLLLATAVQAALACTAVVLSPSGPPVSPPLRQQQQEQQQQQGQGLLSPSTPPPPEDWGGGGGFDVKMGDGQWEGGKPGGESGGGDELPAGDREWFGEARAGFEELLTLQRKTRAKFEGGEADNAANQARVDSMIAHLESGGGRAELLPALRGLKGALGRQAECLRRVIESEERSGEAARDILLALARSEARTLALGELSSEEEGGVCAPPPQSAPEQHDGSAP